MVQPFQTALLAAIAEDLNEVRRMMGVVSSRGQIGIRNAIGVLIDTSSLTAPLLCLYPFPSGCEQPGLLRLIVLCLVTGNPTFLTSMNESTFPIGCCSLTSSSRMTQPYVLYTVIDHAW